VHREVYSKESDFGHAIWLKECNLGKVKECERLNKDRTKFLIIQETSYKGIHRKNSGGWL
jgi:hypothetical protein